MQVNRRLSSELQPVAFNFPSDRKIVCSVRLCPLCKNLRAGRLDEWFHLLQFFYLWYILYKIITKSKTREVQWKQCWYMLDFQGLQNTKNNRKLLILQKTSHFSAVILRIHLHTNKEELFSLNIHLRMPDKNSLKPYDLWKTHTNLHLRHCRKRFCSQKQGWQKCNILHLINI